jgi:hypothetical protein
MDLSKSSKISLIKIVIKIMKTYQRENGIEKCCITNAQILYDFATKSLCIPNVKVVSAFVVAPNPETNSIYFVEGHLCITIDDDLYEPSYDVSSFENSEYYDSFSSFIRQRSKEFVDYFKLTLDVKALIRKNLDFYEYAKQMNEDKFLINDKRLYNEQLDYVISELKRKGLI